MKDGVVSPSTLVESPPGASMDELSFDECGLKTATEGSDFVSSTSIPLSDPSRPALDANGLGSTRLTSKGKDVDVVDFAGASESEVHSVESSEIVGRWWIGPMANPSFHEFESVCKCLQSTRGFNRDKDMLIQIRVPINREDFMIMNFKKLPLYESVCKALEDYMIMNF